jgi:hypothetical protein
VEPTTAFGLDLHCDRSLSFLEGSAVAPGGRALSLRVVGDDPAALAWPATAELISDQRQADGEVVFQIESGGEEGFRISGPRYGASVIAADGSSLRGAPGAEGIAAWQRLLVAQCLPFAAVLQGLDVLHASGVVIDSGAVAFVGPSGSGKTSVATALWRRGCGFLADDVLAVERRGEDLLCHPGAPVAAVDRVEAERLAAAGRLAGEELECNERERVVRVPLNPAPAPLRALFLLDRRRDGPPRPHFDCLDDAQVLLSSTFNLVLASPQRLERLLDACALAARQRVERVVVSTEVDAEDLAAAIEARLEGGA